MQIQSRRFIGSMFVAIGLVTLTAARASAQVLDEMRFTAPFSFVAGKVTFPAGVYTIRPMGDSGVIEISNFKHSAFVSVDPAGRPMTASINAKSGDELVFRLRDGQYVLCQIWENGDVRGDQVVGTPSR